MNYEDVLKKHQKLTVAFQKRNRRSILGDKPGIGKSFPTLVSTLTEERNENILISCGKSAMSVWPVEIEKWFPQHLKRLRIIDGDSYQRRRLWQQQDNGLIWLVTLNGLRQDLAHMPGPWDAVILDEAHKYKNRKSVLFDAVKRIKTDTLYQLTGTPTSRNMTELWAYLHLCDRKKFSSYWGFIKKHFWMEEGAWGNRDIGPLKDQAAFELMLSQYFLRRTEVEGMPPIVENVLPVQMSLYQRQLYRKLVEDMLAETSPGEWLIASTVMAKIVRLRQLLVCPKLLDPNVNDYGAGINGIMDHIDDNEIDHAVIFCPFTAAFPYLRAAIWQRLQIAAHQLVGGTDGDDVKATIKDWEKADRGIILVSTQFAQSFSLIHSQNGYFLGYCYDPNDNEQARLRMLRLNSSAGAFIWGVSHGPGTVDMDIVDILQGKLSKTALLDRLVPTLNAFLDQQIPRQ